MLVCNVSSVEGKCVCVGGGVNVSSVCSMCPMWGNSVHPVCLWKVTVGSVHLVNGG